jgi:hypothetical protein
MTAKATHEVHAIFDDRGLVAGYVFRGLGRSTWGAILQGYCSCCRRRISSAHSPTLPPPRRLSSPGLRRDRGNDR